MELLKGDIRYVYDKKKLKIVSWRYLKDNYN